MSTQPGIISLVVYPYPIGVDNTQRNQIVTSKVTIGAPGYPISITAWSISQNIVTMTATNSLIPGQKVYLSGFGTSTFFNGQIVTVATASGSAFTAIFTHANGSATENGNAALTAPSPIVITAYSITSNVVTFTSANSLASGETVTLSGFPTATFFNGQQVVVLSSGLSGTQFEANFTHANASATETGAATLSPYYTAGGLGINWFPMTSQSGGNFIPDTSAVLPNDATFASEGGSGYIYGWNRTNNTFQIFQSGAASGTLTAPTITTLTNASTAAPVYVTGGALTQAAGATGITGVQAPVFTGTGAAALSEFPDATVLPQAIINDIIVCVAKFTKSV